MDQDTDQNQLPQQAAMPEAATPSTGSYMQPIKPKHVFKGLLKIGLGLLIIAAIGAGIVWFLTRDKIPQAATPAKTPTATTPEASTPIIAKTVKQYDSSTYGLNFTYPSDWIVTDADSKLTVTSPALELEDSSNQAFTGQVVFSIQNKQTAVSQFAAGKAVAALESLKITYAKPTSNQRAKTYVSFVNYAGNTTSINALYVAGDNGYQAEQSIPQSDVIQADPLVNISFLKCAESTCKTTGTEAAIATSMWSEASFSEPLIAILESLIIN